jgi:hypothetical protein
MANVAEEAPAATDTDAGAVELVLFEAKLILVPPAGAGPLSAAVPVDELPPTTDAGETVRLANPAGLIVNVADFVSPPNAQVIVAETAVVTGLVAMARVAEVAPAEMVTVAGTVALELLEVTLTCEPPGPAGPFKVTVAVDDPPPITVAGETVSPLSAAGTIVSVAVCVMLPWEPVMGESVVDDTAVVETRNLAVVDPAETVTVAGTVALELPEVKLMDVPPVGALPFRVTVPLDGCPPRTEVGEIVTIASSAGVTVRVAACFETPSLAVTVTGVEVETGVVLIEKLADVVPDDTVTVAGTVALGLLDDRLTTIPPTPAGPVRVTVPADEIPPSTVVGETVTALIDATLITRIDVIVLAPTVPEIVACVVAATADVEIENEADVAPPATVIAFGGDALELLEESLTTVPPVGAGPFSVTVPVDGTPPTTEVGETLRLSSPGGRTARVASAVAFPNAAVIVALIGAATATVAIENVAVVAPAATVTLVGVEALGLFDERLTTAPLPDAGSFSVTIPVDDVPPTTLAGETVKL